MPGGPGWLSDIFECKIVFEDSCYTTVEDEHQKSRSGGEGAQIKCFDGRGAISGKLIVVPPESRDVTHRGIEVCLTSSSVTSDMANSVLPVVLKTWVLLEAGSVNEPIECPFDIDLSELDLRDTFVGEHLSFRHVVSYRVVRPWYTFSVRGEEAIVIRNCPVEMPAPPEKTVLAVDDFGAECTFDHGKCTFSTDGQLVGTITFRGMSAATSIGEVHVLLGRTEKWTTSSAEDATMRSFVVHSAEQAPVETDITIPVDISLAQMGHSLDAGSPAGTHLAPQLGQLPPTMPVLKPTDPDTDESHVISVEYWIRLLVCKPKEAGMKDMVKQHWDTHPIILQPGTEVGLA